MIQQKLMEKLISISTEYNKIQSDINTNGVTVEQVMNKAVLVGKLETLSWAISVINESKN